MEATIKGTSAETTFAEVMFAPNELYNWENRAKTTPNSNLAGADGANKNIADGTKPNLKCGGADFDGANGAGTNGAGFDGATGANGTGATAILPVLREHSAHLRAGTLALPRTSGTRWASLVRWA